jgi:hypothetical protein
MRAPSSNELLMQIAAAEGRCDRDLIRQRELRAKIAAMYQQADAGGDTGGDVDPGEDPNEDPIENDEGTGWRRLISAE